ncbi:MAG: DMT family transporter, partial [Gammaproteobacteria bacterium]
MLNSISKNNAAILFMVALSGALFGLLGLIGTRLIHLHFSISTMLFWRFSVAFLYLLIIGFYSSKNNFFKDTPWPYHLTAILSGFLFYSASSGFYFLVSKYIGTGLAMVLFFIFPVFVVLFESIFDKFKVTPRVFLSLIMMIFGLFLITRGQTFYLNLFGIFLAISSGLAYALFVLSSKKISKKINSLTLTIDVCFGCALAFLCVSLFNHELFIPKTAIDWFYIIVTGLLCTALPIQMMLFGLKRISASQVAILSVLEPVTTLVVGMLFMHESSSILQILGVFLL